MTERFDDQVLDWLNGQLTAQEAEAFAAELTRNPELARAVAESREALALNALADPVAPSDLLRRRVLGSATSAPASAQPSGRVPTPQRSSAPWQAALVAALVLLAFTTLKWRSTDDKLALAVASRDSLGTDLAQRDSLLAMLASPRLESIELVANMPAPPKIRVMIDSTRHMLFLSAADLPQLEPDHDYQLWYIVAGAPVASTTFHPDRDGSAQVMNVAMPARVSIQALAVTVEPKGGSAAPTTAPRFVTPMGE